MFAKVEVVLPEKERALVIPGSAISYAPFGDLVSITTGLKPGEMVVGTGVFKLRNGMAVTINNDLAPNPQVSPTPADT